MSGMDDRWIAFVTVEDRSGSLTATTECFSTRGVSFTAVNTLDVHDGTGALAFLFAGTERIARGLARTLERLSAVHTVRLARIDDPDVRSLAHASGVADPGLDHRVRECGADIVGRAAGDAIVVTGPYSAVESAALLLRESGAVVTQTVLRPA